MERGTSLLTELLDKSPLCSRIQLHPFRRESVIKAGRVACMHTRNAQTHAQMHTHKGNSLSTPSFFFCLPGVEANWALCWYLISCNCRQGRKTDSAGRGGGRDPKRKPARLERCTDSTSPPRSTHFTDQGDSGLGWHKAGGGLRTAPHAARAPTQLLLCTPAMPARSPIAFGLHPTATVNRGGVKGLKP